MFVWHRASLKILGITIADQLSMSEHVRDVVLECAQSLHVINVLRCHGMNDQALQAVYRSVVLAKLLYASICLVGLHDD